MRRRITSRADGQGAPGAAAPRVYQLKVTLLTVRPAVWRRVLVPTDVSLRRLHRILQIIMGWTDTHLYEFEAGRTSFGDPDEEASPDLRSARGAKLSAVAPAAGARLRYEYDFGDGWEHDVVVEKILEPAEGVRYPVCVAGKRACPPEDCGGPYGYAEYLEAIGDPGHPDHGEKLDWIGPGFDPEAFDLDEVNMLLRRMR